MPVARMNTTKRRCSPPRADGAKSRRHRAPPRQSCASPGRHQTAAWENQHRQLQQSGTTAGKRGNRLATREIKKYELFHDSAAKPRLESL